MQRRLNRTMFNKMVVLAWALLLLMMGCDVHSFRTPAWPRQVLVPPSLQSYRAPWPSSSSSSSSASSLTRLREAVMFEDQEVTSTEIERLRKKIEETNTMVETVRAQRGEEEKILAQLEEEFGGEIARIKKEFARMKERSIEEALEISNKAKSDALKEVLPITDNYYRAKTVFDPIVRYAPSCFRWSLLAHSLTLSAP